MMIHLLVNLGRSLACQRSIHFNHAANYSILRNHGSLDRPRFSSSLCRMFTRYKVPSSGYYMYGRNIVKQSGQRYNHAKNFHALSVGVLTLCAVELAYADGDYIPVKDSVLMRAQDQELAGPAFIKWGQWVATRPDSFPSDLCLELTKLHNGAPEHSFAYSKAAIEKAFGRKLSEIFEHFEETPVASGSIAQVHRASLRFRYPGQQLKKPIEVAVKVDLSREAAQLSRFAYNFRSWKDVSFPKPLYPLVHPSVLVETFEQGDGVAHYIDDRKGNPRIKRDLARIGTYALLKMLLVDNFIHADMHPGNILVRVPQKRPKKKLFRVKPHLIFLDVGITAELSQNDRLNLVEFFKAVAVRDGRTAAECTLKLAKRQNCPNPEAFVEELERTFSFWGSPEGDIFHPAECMHQLLEQVRRHKVSIDGNVCTVLFSILVLEGWQRKLDPEFDIMHTLKTLLLKEEEWTQPIDAFFS